MTITILCTARSGSTNLTNYLGGVLNIPITTSPFMRGSKDISLLNRGGLFKLFIHNQTEGFDSLYLFGNEVINRSHKTILYDRRDKEKQSESLAYRQTRYSDDLSKYHNKEDYDMSIVPQEKIDECKFHFGEHSLALQQLSENHNLPIFYYEDIFLGNGLDNLNEYLSIETNHFLKDLYLNQNKKERVNRNISLI